MMRVNRADLAAMADKTKDVHSALMQILMYPDEANAQPTPPSPPASNEKPQEETFEPVAGQRIIPWGAHVSNEFLMSCLWIEDQLGGPKVENLMTCMKFESNLKPDAKNPMSSGSGLIQFMESTARRLGTTTANLRAMSATRQLSYVYKYFKEYKDRGFKLHQWSLEDTYMAILWPAAIGKSEDFRVFINDPNKMKDAYDVNKGLDLDKDGFITKKEAAAKVVRLYNQGTTPENAGFL